MSTSQKVGLSSHILTPEDLWTMPEPIQRYIRQSGVLDKEIPNAIYLKQQGLFNLTGKKWMPLKAEQWFDTEKGEFIWKARSGVMHVVDQFVKNKGSLTVRLFNWIKVEDANGPEIDQGEALRYLAECIWFPTGFLSETITWEGIDAHSAKGSIQYGDKFASAIFHLNEGGEITRITAKRYAKEKEEIVLRDWEIHGLEYKYFGDVRIPYKARVGWKRDGQVQDYYKFEITEIAYDAS